MTVASVLALFIFAAGCNNLEAIPRRPHSESITSGDGWVRVECNGDYCDADNLLAKVSDDRARVTLVINGKWILARRGKIAGTPAVRDISLSFPVTGVKSVVVHSSGDIAFVPSPDSKITVLASVVLGDARLSETERKRLIAGFQMTSENNDGILHLTVKPPVGFSRETDYSVNCRISVPSGASLGLEGQSENGAISARETHVTGTVRLHSGYGQIDAVDAGGQIDAITGHGYISVKSDRFMRRIFAHTDNGPVWIKAAVEVIDAESANGAVTIQAGAGSRKVAAISHYGQVIIRGTDDPAESIHAESDNGAVVFFGAMPHAMGCHSKRGRVSASLTRADTAGDGIGLSADQGPVDLAIPATASVHFNTRTESGAIHAPGIEGHTRHSHAASLYVTYFEADLNGGRTPVFLSSDHDDVSIRTY